LYGTDYLAAQPDACQAYAAPVMGHMNDDHGEATVAMVKHYIGLDVDKVGCWAWMGLG